MANVPNFGDCKHLLLTGLLLYFRNLICETINPRLVSRIGDKVKYVKNVVNYYLKVICLNLFYC